MVPAAAHEEIPGVTNVLDSIEPAPPAGLTIQVTRSVADQVIVENTTSEELEVLGEDGLPFIRIGPNGVEHNRASPDLYRSYSPEGVGLAASEFTAGEPAKWVKVSEHPAWGWFDHRLHRASLARPPQAVPGQSVVLERWTIPMRYGGDPLRATGRRLYSRPTGTFRHTIVHQIPRTETSVLSGKVPALFLQVEEKIDELILFGVAGEPFLRFGPGSVEGNAASPTWVLTARGRGSFDPEAPLGADLPPRWELVGPTPYLAWLEPRAVPSEEGADFTWSIPGQLDGEPVSLRGRSVWVPLKEDESGGVGDWRPAAAAGGLVLLAAAGSAVAVRSRAQAAPPDGRG